jgi:hypothetical protein
MLKVINQNKMIFFRKVSSTLKAVTKLIISLQQFKEVRCLNQNLSFKLEANSKAYLVIRNNTGKRKVLGPKERQFQSTM